MIRTIALRCGLAAALSMATVAGVCAQGFGLPGANRAKPLEIHADNGVEWDQAAQTYTAHGNASAAQSGVTVFADTLTAHYRDDGNGNNEIWRIDATKDVRIVSASQSAYGDTGVYDIDQGVLVLRGEKLRMITKTDQIFARDSLEYWEKRSLAVARGDAIVVRGDKRLRADAMTAYFRKNNDGQSEMRRIDAIKNVVISTPVEIVRANEAVYDVQSGIAFLTGSVKITRGQNQLNGEKAEVNLNTGVSRLYENVSGQINKDSVNRGSEIRGK